MHKELARLLIASAAARENSYDHTASDEASAKADAEIAAKPDNLYAGIVDYRQFYKLSLHEACEKVCPPEMVEPVYLLLAVAWNDALDWANRQVGEQNG